MTSHHSRVVRQAQASLSRGWRVIPLRPRSKVPREKDWPHQVLTESDLEDSFVGDSNIGVVLGKVSRGLADVDLDAAEAITVGSQFLPATDRMHGRANKPHSHAFYVCDELLKPEKYVDVDGTVLVELRSNGQQTVIPPSIHPSGEGLTWERKGEPSRVHAEELRRTVGRVAAGVLFARHWPAQGNRHEVAMALAGALLRGGWDLDLTVRFVGAVARAAGDEEWRSRMADAGTTSKRIAAGRAATGIPRLADIVGEAVVTSARDWLGLNPSVEVRGAGESIITTPSWPEPPASEAYYGLAGELVHAIEPFTEADKVALLIQVLAVFGNVIGRRPYFVAEADRHHTNLFTVLVGVTAKGRKGSSLGQVRHPFTEVDAKWASNCAQTGLSSGEGVIWAVRDPIVRNDPIKKNGRVVGYEKVLTDHGVEDKRLIVMETEFASVLRIMGREGNTLSATVRQAWDTGDLHILTKNSPAKATGAHISIIGHITRDELRRDLGTTEVANGFANRFLWACVRRSKILPEAGRIDEGDLDLLVRHLQEAVEFARTIREMRRGNKARDLWFEIYPELSEGRPGLLGAVISRAEAQVMRLACIYALLDCSTFIHVEHLRAALALWKYCAASARYIFGDTLGDPMADELLSALRSRPKGLTRTEIRDLFARNRAGHEIDRALSVLLEYGLVRRERCEPEGGRPSERWAALGMAPRGRTA